MLSFLNRSCRNVFLPYQRLLTLGAKPSTKVLPSYRLLQTLEDAQIEQQKQRNKEVQEYTELVRDFLDPAEFYLALRKIDIDFFCGVPDSLLKNFCAYVTANVSKNKHVITSNEGSAVALAAGYHLATGKNALVYLQNSGLGNIVNPLTSLTAGQVYGIPMLLLIGWRGEPGKKDEPQHLLKGQVTPSILACLNMPFQVLPDFQEGAEEALYGAQQHMIRSGTPYALLVKRQTFLPFKLPYEIDDYPLNREEAVKLIADNLGDFDAIVGTTGMLSRELYEYRDEKRQSHKQDFLTVGSMGHAVSISLGIAISKPSRQVFCLDGDGSVIMHMGSLSTVGEMAPDNFKHIVINNGAHDSVGGQPTAAKHTTLNLIDAAVACGYRETFVASTAEEIMQGIAQLKASKGPSMLEIKVCRGARKNLGRPATSPQENKKEFMKFLTR